MKIIIGIMLAIISITYFISDSEAEFGKEFILKKEESTAIGKTGSAIKMLGNGTKFVSLDGDRPYCDFELTTEGETDKFSLNVGENVSYRKLSVQLVAVDTTADPKAADPWGRTTCKFVVTKK